MAKYGLIGKDLAHSQSKLLHSYLGNYDYDIIEVEDAAGLEAVLRDESYSGFNVTIPYKQDVMKYLDELSDRAVSAGAVNCVRRMKDGKLKGFNTDIYGFECMVGDRVKDKKCLILGTGGAARAVAVALENQGAGSIVFVSRDPASARGRIDPKFKVISYYALPHYYDTQVIVNATPVGQLPNNGLSPINEAGRNMHMFSQLEIAIDLIYNPYRTKFLQDAKRLTGCRTMSGLEMLIIQAIDSRNIWMDRHNNRLEEIVAVRHSKKKLLAKQLNIVAVGMPGSGKTTIFRRFAYMNGFNFIDVDEVTERLMGEKIVDVLGPGGKGEEYFREMEAKAVQEVCRQTDSVIATGGGSILNPISRDLLRSNGIVVYVKRPLDKLATKNRPLSEVMGVIELFKKRDGIYYRMSDFVINNSSTFGAELEQGENAREYNRDMNKYAGYIMKRVEKYLSDLADNKWV